MKGGAPRNFLPAAAMFESGDTGTIVDFAGEAARRASGATWGVKGHEFVHCSGTAGCSCQFQTWIGGGASHAVAGLVIDRGYHRATRLDGMKMATVFVWPGSIQEGKGEAIAIIEQSASPKQCAALLDIMLGRDGDPGRTFFGVFSRTYGKYHGPVPGRIGFDFEANRRAARFSIAAAYEGGTGETSFAVPCGFDDIVDEIGRAWSRQSAKIEFDIASPICI